MRAVVIINPIAGPGRARTLEACRRLAVDTMAAQGFDAVVRVTTAPEDARRFAGDAVKDGAALVVAWGGDGTINGAGAALAFTGVPLGIVPGGSGNGLARDLGVPLEPSAALALAAQGTSRPIDAGELGGSLFFNVAGIGLDAAIAARLAAPGARRGLAGYVQATLSELPSYSARPYTIRLGTGEELREEAVFIALANSRQYGNGAQIAPQARLDDGLIDLVVVRRQSILRILSQVPAFFRGTLREGPGLLMRAADRIEIDGDGAIPFHVDGEPRSSTVALQLRVHPGALMARVSR